MPPRRGHDEKTHRTHIPRPPNAFILFRSSFIRSKHVPGKVEGNHSTLSKIIGLCWKALSQQERRTWEEKARLAQAEHRTQYPDWRWTPEGNALGKKRARKTKKNEPDDDADSSEPAPKRKTRSKEKGKARARDLDVSELDEDVRVAKIADLVKEGKTGAELETALGEWQATLAAPDPRPAKKRRSTRNVAAEPAALPSSSALPPSAPSPPPTAAVFSHEPSHTPSPTAFYSPHRPVVWPENAAPASSYPPSYSPWWTPTSSAYDPPPEITTEGMGYPDDDTTNFAEFAQSHDGHEGPQWTRNQGRNGICTVITDPLPECDNSPTTSSPTTVNTPHFPTSAAPNAVFIPSTYSTLTGWAGEYGPSSSGGPWFDASWRPSSPWGHQPNLHRPINLETSHQQKIPTYFRAHPPPLSAPSSSPTAAAPPLSTHSPTHSP